MSEISIERTRPPLLNFRRPRERGASYTILVQLYLAILWRDEQYIYGAPFAAGGVCRRLSFHLFHHHGCKSTSSYTRASTIAVQSSGAVIPKPCRRNCVPPRNESMMLPVKEASGGSWKCRSKILMLKAFTEAQSFVKFQDAKSISIPHKAASPFHEYQCNKRGTCFAIVKKTQNDRLRRGTVHWDSE